MKSTTRKSMISKMTSIASKTTRKISVLAGIMLIISMLSTSLYAQNTAGAKTRLSTALELYQNKMYQNAIAELNKDIQQNGENETSAGYKVLCSIRLRHNNAEGLARAYKEKYPYSPMITVIRFRLGVLAYDRAEYEKAERIFDEIDDRLLIASERPEYYFKQGFCQFKNNEISKAEKTFNLAVEQYDGGVKSQYILPVKYYLGYIKYLRQEFRPAVVCFTEASADFRYKDAARFYILDCKFMLKDYEYVVANGPAVCQKLQGDEKKRAAIIIAKAAFALNDAQTAMEYFDTYVQNSETLSPQDNYLAGIISYTLKDYDKATAYFSEAATEATDSGDTLAQNANYHLGECYISSGNKPKAKDYFKKAASIKADKKVEEDAFYNYAKLDFETTGRPDALQQYLTKYRPSIAKSNEVYGYLALNSVNKKDYQGSVEALNKIKSPSAADLSNVQKVSFLLGSEYYDKGSYAKAAEYFGKAAAGESVNKPLSNLAKFWQAECYYMTGSYTKSQKILTALQSDAAFKQSREYAQSFFNSGYNYFKMKELAKAEKNFKQFITMRGASAKQIKEAKTRIADCKFMERDFDKASELYTQASQESSLYAPLQKAVAQGLLNNHAEQISILTDITSPKNRDKKLYTEALYELGRAQVQTGKNAEARATFNRLITNAPDTLFYSKALLEMGMISSNAKQYDEAKAYYKKVIAFDPDSPEAQAALSALENVCQIQGRPEEFLDFVNNSNITENKSGAEREEIIFNSAEQIYLSNKWEAAIKALETYREEYRSGEHVEQATYYLADCYRRTKDINSALENYKTASEYSDSPFRCSALLNYAELCLQKRDFQEAERAYETLESLASAGEFLIPALSGQAMCEWEMKNYSKSIAKAAKALSLDSLDNKTKNKMLYYTAKSHLALGEESEAMDCLKRLSSNLSSAEGSEAAYMLVNEAFKEGKWDKVEKQVLALADSKKMHSYWLAKSFLLLGDAYVKKGEKEQALATFKSVRDNYRPSSSDDDNIKEIASSKVRGLAK